MLKSSFPFLFLLYMKLLLKYLGRHKGVVILALFLAAINQGFSLLDPYITGKVVDQFIEQRDRLTRTEFITGVLRWVGLGIGAAMVSRIAKNFQDYFTNIIIQKVGARMYAAGDGAIFVNGIDVRELRLKSLRSTVSFVPQEAPIFDASLLENLRYGNPKASDSALESVIQITQLENVIARLALGWNEPVGPRGNKLSGGERQRVALARALLQRPQIIVLDESTSALDAVTEQNLFEAMSEVSQETITIVISHRLSTIMWADRIVVIDRGRVIAEGSHSSLYETNLSYRLLCESQFELEPKIQVVKKIQLQHGDAAVVARRSLVGTAG